RIVAFPQRQPRQVARSRALHDSIAVLTRQPKSLLQVAPAAGKVAEADEFGADIDQGGRLIPLAADPTQHLQGLAVQLESTLLVAPAVGQHGEAVEAGHLRLEQPSCS